MVNRLLCCALLIWAGCQSQPERKNEQENTVRQAAEFEPTQAVWLLWSNYDHKRGCSNEKVTLDIINALLPYTEVKLVFADDSLRRQKTSLLPAKALETGQLKTFVFPYREFWTRDLGPAFIIKNNQLAIADFNFNDWGYGTTTDSLTALNEKLDEKIAAHLQVPMVSTNLITEGGDHEVNGKGTLLVTESVEQTRNPDMTREQIEAAFKTVLGVKKIVWLKSGLCEDDNTQTGPLTNKTGEKVYMPLTTNGHVDEYVRFVNPTTVLLAAVDTTEKDPISLENARRLEANYQILRQTTDQDGQPLNIVRIPLPHHIFVSLESGDGVYDIIKDYGYKDGSVFPKNKPVKVIAAASYLNFLIANGCVLMPKYWTEGQPLSVKNRDAESMAVLQSVFPDKKIIALDVLAVNLGGGGIHCITRNEPKLK